MTALVKDLFETMYTAPGRGLAAPQIGVMSRVFVMDTTWKEGEMTPVAFINPEVVVASEDTASMAEGCLSIPGVLADVTRPAVVTMRWTDLTGATRTQTFTGFAAACVQHELDHLNGTVTFDRLPPDARAEKEAEYLA